MLDAVHGVHLKYAAASALCALLRIALGHHSQMPMLALALAYAAAVHALIVALFVARSGMWILGKSHDTGQLPAWSYLLWWPFLLLNHLYTAAHTRIGFERGVPYATEVAAGWWLGGRYGGQLVKRYAQGFDSGIN